ncbi:hypothetical protein Efla_004019 [Eimeria flavescens]
MAPLQATKRPRGPEAEAADGVGVNGDVCPDSGRLLNPLSPNPSPHFNAALQQCVYPHILSYNTFADCYIEEIVKELPFIYVDPHYEQEYHELNPYYKPVDCEVVAQAHWQLALSLFSGCTEKREDEFANQLIISYSKNTSIECELEQPRSKALYVVPAGLKVGIADAVLGVPQKVGTTGLQAKVEDSKRLLPRHCRDSHVTYGAPLHVSFVCWRTGDEGNTALKKTTVIGQIQILDAISIITTVGCNLHEIVPKEACPHNCNNSFSWDFFVLSVGEGMSPTEMVKAGEDVDELGGYFIINGNERVLRFVIQQKTNYPIALKRESFRNREVFATDLAILLRSQRFDGTCTSNILLDTEDGRCCYRILLNRQEHFCPFLLLLRCVGGGLSLQQLKLKFMEGSWGDIEEATQLHALFEEAWGNEKDFVDTDLTEHRPLHQLGQVFWRGVGWLLRPGSTYEDAGRFIIDRYVLVHVKDWASKFETLLLMFRKLRLLRAGKIPPESMDAFSYQEVVLPGQILAAVLKDALFSALVKLRTHYMTELRQVKAAGHDPALVISSNKFFDVATDRCASEIGHKIGYFMATGNIRTSQLDLQQLSGWTVTADRLNINRFLSHFRAVHRGQFFSQMKTTTVRKLLGESWGFLCPVHTPDGAPCGLLLHLAQMAQPVAVAPDREAIATVRLFMKARGACADLEGLSGLPPADLGAAVGERALGHGKGVNVKCSPLFEGIFVFTMPGRLVRPVKHIASGRVEFIGPLQQPWMSIACREKNVSDNERAMKAQLPIIEELLGASKTSPADGSCGGLSQHRLENAFESYLEGEEIGEKRLEKSRITDIVQSVREALVTRHVPLSYDYCQMLKQTMGTPFHSIPYRHDNKAYRLITPQKPLLRTKDYRHIDFDDYPTGVNAVVAVMCYTGFDMEDAMILNKSSVERGMFHGCVYKTKIVDAAPSNARVQEAEEYQFNNTSKLGRRCIPNLDADGLPAISSKITQGKTLCRVQRHAQSAAALAPAQQTLYKDDEPAYVDGVTLTHAPPAAEERVLKTGLKGCRASVRLRSVRKPIIGDKFASRHGQKGILSMLWPHEDMPFAESGLVPDILFNPHGFPSRMTIGMLIESMAGKAAAVHGAFQDATAFREFPKQKKTGNRWIDQEGHHGYVLRGGRYRTPEEEAAAQEQGDTPVDYFGKALLASGYQYYGKEELYSGVYGVPLTCHIFTGLIYYQRLRHMVTDKAQVRATGPIDSLTHQPVQGRKRHGGVRFGEMERDALIAHGAAALLQDRLLHCSDAHRAFCCPSCGSILSPTQRPDLKGRSVGGKKPVPFCRVCNVPCRLVQLPYVFRYLSNELAAMNVTIRLELEHMHAPLQVKQQHIIDDEVKASKYVKTEVDSQVSCGSDTKRQEPRQVRGHAA